MLLGFRGFLFRVYGGSGVRASRFLRSGFREERLRALEVQAAGVGVEAFGLSRASFVSYGFGGGFGRFWGSGLQGRI